MDLQQQRPIMPPLRGSGKFSMLSSPTRSTSARSPLSFGSPINCGIENLLYLPPTQTRLRHAIAQSGQTSSSSADNNKNACTPQRLIEKLLCRLPDDVKSNIIEVVSAMSSSIKRLETTVDNQRAELRDTKEAHDIKKNELLISVRNCEVYRGRISDMEEKNATLVDAMSVKDKRSSKTQLAISRLNDTNLTLKDALFLIDVDVAKRSSNQKETLPSARSRQKNNQCDTNDTDCDITDDDCTLWFTKSKGKGDLSDCDFGYGSPPRLATVASTSPSPLPPEKPKSDRKNYEKSTYAQMSQSGFPDEEIGRKVMNERRSSEMKGENMRNTMLKLSREKYRYTKKLEILSNEVEELKTKLKLSELKCRHLQINLAEFTGTDRNNDFSFNVTAAHALLAKSKDFGPQDDLFRMMIDRRAIDPVESILQFRRLVDWMVRVPEGSLKISKVVAHMCSEHVMEILNVDVVCVYVIDPTSAGDTPHVSKHTVRSEVGEVIDYTAAPSILSHVIRTGEMHKYAEIKLSDFNVKIDGCPGIVVRNILSIPVKNEVSGQVIGVIHLINKIDGKVAFTELDETFASYFALMAASQLQGCFKFQHVSYRADLLTSILASTAPLLALVTHKSDVFVKVLHVGELLSVLESSCQAALKCFKVKAFIVSDHVKGMPSGHLVFSQEKARCSPSKTHRSAPSLTNSKLNIGIAGFIVRTKTSFVQIEGDVDGHFHPEVDLDPLGMPCMTLAILNIEGEVLACLQMICGPGSPKVHLSDSRADGITFEQAAQWYALSLSTPLQCVIENMNAKTQLREDNLRQSVSNPSGDENLSDVFNSFSADEMAYERQQRDHLISLGILNLTGKAKQSPVEWAASLVKTPGKPSAHAQSGQRSGCTTPESVWSRRSSV